MEQDVKVPEVSEDASSSNGEEGPPPPPLPPQPPPPPRSLLLTNLWDLLVRVARNGVLVVALYLLGYLKLGPPWLGPVAVAAVAALYSLAEVRRRRRRGDRGGNVDGSSNNSGGEKATTKKGVQVMTFFLKKAHIDNACPINMHISRSLTTTSPRGWWTLASSAPSGSTPW